MSATFFIMAGSLLGLGFAVAPALVALLMFVAGVLNG